MANFTDSSSPSLGYDTYAHYACNLIQAFDNELKGTETLPPNIPRSLTAPLIQNWVADISSVGLVGILDAVNYQTAADINSTKLVGILGAGPGRLYTALILQDLGIPYCIIEAQGKDGISLKTKVKLFLFVGGGNNNILYSYNGVTVQQNAMPPSDPFKADQVIQDVGNSNPYIAVGVKAIMDDVIGPFATCLLDDLKTGGSEAQVHTEPEPWSTQQVSLNRCY
ncbi:uncharacterized protein BJ212DRAFT_1487758 [Suillus subaureus]|uniref:Uncharacterized protein n=1 Tax=Suillus subaureus TaxID=48587 RepID=A0A9P7DR83_9AGAM|nr:uncharacterized protein BJ212DRAFT_1487758 [Suillus subaureus]KAG1801167.1 hypothetical protein BJ212DRAFT_1487758 [Suillus subaureus]